MNPKNPGNLVQQLSCWRISVVIPIAVAMLLSTPSTAAVSPWLDDSLFINPSEQKKVSLDFKNADLADVLKIFSQQSGQNFIASQEVGDRKVTLFLDNIPVDEALRKILDANNLMYQEDGSGLFVVRAKPVAARSIITRVYALKYATVSSSKLNTMITVTKNLTNTAKADLKLTDDSPAASKSKTDGGVGAVVRSVLTDVGIVVEDPRTNSLIITDDARQFGVIEQMIAQLDVPVPQVLIEVEMLDVSKVTSELMGVKYGSTPLTLTGAQRDTLYPFDQNRIINNGDADTPAYRVGTVNAAGLSATLQFLRTRSDTRNLARPRLLTLNNETAEIKIATDEAIGISTKTDSSQSTATQSVQAERVQTGVFLKVTPQVYLATREIVLAIAPKVIQARTGGTFQGQTFKDPEERGSQAILKVKDGQTIIIGGLLRTDDSNTLTKLPILGDLPFVGGMFRHKDKSGSERELIIFMTPHIIDDSLPNNTLFQPDDRQRIIERDLSILEQTF